MSSPAATSSPPLRPGPARQPHSCCRSWSGCAEREHDVLAGPTSGSRPHPTTHPRIGDAGQRQRQRLWPPRAASTGVVYGGVPVDPQIKELLRGIEILVATPGRLLDHIGQKSVISGRSRSSSWTRRTGCWTWASCPTSARSSNSCRPAARISCSRQRSPTRSDDWRGQCSPTRQSVEVAASQFAADRPVRQLVYPVDRDRKERCSPI